MSKPPFKVLGIEHVALAVKDVDTPSNLFGSLLGIEHTSSEEIADQKVNTHIFDTSKGKIELLDALSDDSPISKFLENREEGIHHIAFKVDKLQLALDYLKHNFNNCEMIENKGKLSIRVKNIYSIEDALRICKEITK